MKDTNEKMRELANDAVALVAGEKRSEYGEVEDSFAAIAQIWSGILGWQVGAKEVALCMAGLKLYRESFAGKRDNRLDAVAYMLCVEAMVPVVKNVCMRGMEDQ